MIRNRAVLDATKTTHKHILELLGDEYTELFRKAGERYFVKPYGIGRSIDYRLLNSRMDENHGGLVKNVPSLSVSLSETLFPVFLKWLTTVL